MNSGRSFVYSQRILGINYIFAKFRNMFVTPFSSLTTSEVFISQYTNMENYFILLNELMDDDDRLVVIYVYVRRHELLNWLFNLRLLILSCN